jgi:hypothetical protein
VRCVGPALCLRSCRASFPVLVAGQYLRQMHRADARPLTMQRTANVHQAAVVASGADLRPGIQYVTHFFRQHRARDRRVLYGKRAAKSAASLHVGQLYKLNATNRPKQLFRAIAQGQAAQPMTARVIRHAMWVVGAHIGEAEPLGKKLGKLKDSR